MSLFEGAGKYQLNDFRGMMDYGDTQDVPVGNAVTSFNCEFIQGATRSRRGFGSAWAMASSSNYVV